MRHSRTIMAAAVGGLCLVFVVHSAGVGQSPLPVDAKPPAAPAYAPSPAAAERPATVTSMATAEGMMGFASPGTAGGQLVTLVDSRRGWMAVYAVDEKGQIRLLSSRPLEQDFSVQFNVTDPTPAEIGRLKSR